MTTQTMWKSTIPISAAIQGVVLCAQTHFDHFWAASESSSSFGMAPPSGPRGTARGAFCSDFELSAVPLPDSGIEEDALDRELPGGRTLDARSGDEIDDESSSNLHSIASSASTSASSSSAASKL